jgi:hypothetical protein
VSSNAVILTARQHDKHVIPDARGASDPESIFDMLKIKMDSGSCPCGSSRMTMGLTLPQSFYTASYARIHFNSFKVKMDSGSRLYRLVQNDGSG